MDYIKIDDNDQALDVKYNTIKGNEADLAELKTGPPYACKVLTLENGKNLVAPETNDKFPKKTYTLDLTKCDEIFDFLVAYDQILMPQGAKVPP